MVPYLKAGDYDSGITLGVREIAQCGCRMTPRLRSQTTSNAAGATPRFDSCELGNARPIFDLVFFGIYLLVRLCPVWAFCLAVGGAAERGSAGAATAEGEASAAVLAAAEIPEAARISVWAAAVQAAAEPGEAGRFSS